MAEISREQRELLARFADPKRHPSELLAQYIWRFIREKPDDEPLDPQWLGIWDKYKRRMVDNLPRGVIEEIDKSLQLIQVVDEDIWSIRSDEGARITFLLGAGASAPSGIPTVDKLLSELWNRARKIGRSDLDRLARWCDEQGITNIEDLLTAAYISNFAATNRGITSLFKYFLFTRAHDTPGPEELYPRRPPTTTAEVDVSSIGFIQDTLQTLFGLLTSTMLSAKPNPTHDAIANFLEQHKNSSIITTNYDGCMDEALLRRGIPIKRTMGSEAQEENPDATELIKMHGSINWTYCDSCQDVRQFDLLELKETYENDKLSYPVIGLCKNCGGLRRPLLVPPLSFKFLMFPHLIDVWNSASQGIEQAEYLVVVGYSFSEADTYITKIISRSMSMNKKQKMLIVNTDHRLAPAQRERFSARIDGFDERRILSACEGSETILPQIVESMLGAARQAAKTKPTRAKR